MKKFIIGMSIAGILASAGVGVGLTKHYSNIRYSPAEQQQEYNRGYEDGTKSDLLLKDKIKLAKEQISILTTTKTTLTIELDTQKELLANLKDDYASKVDQNKDILQSITKTQNTILELENSISSTNDKIKKLQELIASLEVEEEKYIISYLDDNENVLGVDQAVNGVTTNVPIVDSTQYREFLGWYLDDVLIDPTTYVFTQNTTLHAKYQYRYDVHFKIDNNVFKTVLVDKGATTSVPELPSNIHSVTSWMLEEDLNLSKSTNVSEYVITKETTFVAFGVKHYLTYNYYDQNGNLFESNQEVELTNFSKLPNSLITPTGYIFKGWYCPSDQTWLANINYVGHVGKDYYAIMIKDSVVNTAVEIVDITQEIVETNYGSQYYYNYTTNAPYVLTQKAYGEIDYAFEAEDFELSCEITLSNGKTYTVGKKYQDGIDFKVTIIGNENGMISLRVTAYRSETNNPLNILEFYQITNFEIKNITYTFV